MAAVVHSAGIQDRDGAKPVLKKLVGRFPRLEKILADGIYNGGIADWAKEVGGWILELVVRPEGADEVRGLEVALDRRADVRLAGPLSPPEQGLRGAEESSESWIYVAMTHLMLRRLEPA